MTHSRSTTREAHVWLTPAVLTLGTFLVLAGLPRPVTAQGPPDARVCGTVSHERTGAGVEGVQVMVAAMRSAVTDSAGAFCIGGVPVGPAELRIAHIALSSLPVAIVVPSSGTVLVDIRVAELAILLPGVEVTARERGAQQQGSTTSRIERTAIEHLQAASLADVLQLVPGQLATNPSLAAARQSLLREVPTSAAAVRANALGTALVVDGAPLSNNANLQTDVTILNSPSDALPPFSSVAGRGPDLRQVSPDEIESIEVVRGVPSARHGDLTAGAILVETRVGQRRPELRLRMNPTLLDGNISAGWGDGERTQGWSATGTLTGSQDDPRQTLDNYYRGTLALAWRSRSFLGGRASATVRATGYSTLDEQRRDPDDARYQRERHARDRGIRVSSTGEVRSSSRPLDRIAWTLSLSAARQEGAYQELISRSISPLATAVTDTTMRAEFGPSEYLNQTTVDGRPVNGYARLEFETARSTGGWLNRIVAGLEWRHDANRGGGRQFDVRTPPRQSYSVGDRPRSFRDTPALNVLSAYVEDRAGGEVAGVLARLHAGLRLDNADPRSPWSGRYGALLQPRLAAVATPIAGLDVRAAYGLAAKVPPLAFLHPGPRYFDLVNVNHYAADPAERLLIITTRVIEPSTESVRMYAARKFEVGFDLRRGEAGGSLVWFDERADDVLGWRRNVAAFPVARWDIIDQPAGAPPILSPEPVAYDTVVSAYDAPDGTRSTHSRGLEFTLYLPEWQAARLTALVSGAWTRTTATDAAPTVDVWRFLGSSQPVQRAGVYPTEGQEAARLATSIRLIHRAPEVGLVISGLVQTVWRDRDRWVDVSALPVGYVDRGGAYVELSPENAASPAYADLVRPISESYGIEEVRPPLWLLNLRLSKALPAGLRLAFFVNNVLSDRPLYPSRRTETHTQRNPPMSFGAELVSRVAF